jgi:hypothetical protein
MRARGDGMAAGRTRVAAALHLPVPPSAGQTRVAKFPSHRRDQSFARSGWRIVTSTTHGTGATARRWYLTVQSHAMYGHRYARLREFSFPKETHATLGFWISSSANRDRPTEFAVKSISFVCC